MKKLIFKNMANLVVFIRSLLIFLVIYLFSVYSFGSRVTGLILLIIVALLDWADGHIARRCRIASRIGGALDTLGDRITENLLLIFFTYVRIIPLFVPLVFVARSFLADFVRYQFLGNGVDTFLINKSRLGMLLVASRPSRTLYLISKISVFFLAGSILVIESAIASYNIDLHVFLGNLRDIVFYGSIFVVLFNIVRFALLIYDARYLLRENFLR